MRDGQGVSYDLSSILERAKKAKGKPLTTKERKKLEALHSDLQKAEQKVAILRSQYEEDLSAGISVSICARPKPEDFGLTTSDIQSIRKVIKRGMRINKFLSWFLFAIAILGGLAVWSAYNGLFAVVTFCWMILMGLNVSDSKRLIKLWNFRQRHIIKAYYQFEIKWWAYFRKIEKSSLDFWESLSGRDFEFEIGELFRTHGYTVNVTGGSGDMGVDLAMTKDDKYIVVQCKRYKNPANPAVVRELYGSLTATGAHEAILVCTGGFTSGVYKFVKGKPIQLIDMDGILALQNITVEAYDFLLSKLT